MTPEDPSLPVEAGRFVPIDAELGRRLRWHVAHLSGIDAQGIASKVEVEPGDAPPPALRVELQGRLRALDRWLAPIGTANVLPLVHRLFNGLKSGRGEVQMLASRIASYPDVLGPLPPFAVREAIEAFIAGREGDRIYVPTAAQVRSSAVEKSDAARRERRSIAILMSAKVKEARAPAEHRAAAAAAARRAFGIAEPAPHGPGIDPREEVDRVPGREADPSGRSACLVAAMGDAASAASPDAAGSHRGGMTDQELREARALSEAMRTGTSDPRPLPKFSARHRRSLGLPPELPAEPVYPHDRFGDGHAA